MSMLAKGGTPDQTMAPSAARKRRDKRKARQRGTVVKNVACPSCRSKGNDSTGNHLMVFDDGAAHCPKCPKTYKAGEWETANATKNAPQQRNSYNSNSSWNGRPKKLTVEDLAHMGFAGWNKRGISKAADEHFGVKTKHDPSNGAAVTRYYPYKDGGELMGYKPRVLPKDFTTETAIGTIKGTDLYGWDRCKGQRHTLVIVEGEEDCHYGWDLWKAMNARSTSRRVKRSNPHIVSLGNGAKGVQKQFMKHLPELLKYKRIIWMGDNYHTDEEGKKALEAAVRLLGAKRVEVAEYPEHTKDLGDLKKLGAEEAIDMFAEMWFGAKSYCPADIKQGGDYEWDEVFKAPVIGLDFPLDGLCEAIGGMRLREHTVWMAGSGLGKTTFCRKLAHHMASTHGWKCGSIFLEEQDEQTVQGYIALHKGVPLHKLRGDPDMIPKEERAGCMEYIKDNHIFLTHNGSIETEALMDKVRHMYSMGCKMFIIDHLTMATNLAEDQRLALDELMEALYKFCGTHDVHVHSVIHLNRTAKLDFSRGAEVSETNIRGSAGVMQQVWNAIALEGDNQHEEYPHHRFARVLKCREIPGATGMTKGAYIYNPETGDINYDATCTKDMILMDKKNFSPSSKPMMGAFNNKAA